MKNNSKKQKTQEGQSSSSSLPVLFPDTAGIDIGSKSHFVAVPSERDSNPVREFSTRKRMGDLMPHRKISGCGDETFFHNKMLMVFMEASSGFILAEQEEEKRDAATWEKVIEAALKGLNVELIQVTGDEASGLTSAVTN